MGRTNLLFAAWLIYSLATALIVACLGQLGANPL